MNGCRCWDTEALEKAQELCALSHTLPCASLPSGSFWVISLYKKLVIYLVPQFPDFCELLWQINEPSGTHGNLCRSEVQVTGKNLDLKLTPEVRWEVVGTFDLTIQSEHLKFGGGVVFELFTCGIWYYRQCPNWTELYNPAGCVGSPPSIPRL